MSVVSETVWEPKSQRQFDLIASTEDEVLYGGAKGGMKTESLVISQLTQIEHPLFKGLLLRQTFPELQEIMDRADRYYPIAGGEWIAGEARWKFESGASIEIGYFERAEHIKRYQGREWTEIGFDEIGNLGEEKGVDLLIAEMRSPAPDLFMRFRASANPGGAGHAWLKRRYISPTQKGQKVSYDPLTGRSRRFIPARVTDNPIYANDKRYMAVLDGLPDLLRRQLRDGDWDAGAGMALDELDDRAHFVNAFRVPHYWYQWGAFDWGFRHPWSFGWYAEDTDGNVYKCDTITGRGMNPPEVAQEIRRAAPVNMLKRIDAGHDCWYGDHKGRYEDTPTVAEMFIEHGILLTKANIDRTAGLQNMRHYIAWRNKTPPISRFRFMDTPGNRKCFEQLQGIVMEEDTEKPLKVNADENGNGGDDMFDETRYGLAARPMRAQEPGDGVLENAWDPEVLAAEVERKRVKFRIPKPGQRTDAELDPMFGSF